jgi:diguanylate cyclase (GGDEF) domain
MIAVPFHQDPRVVRGFTHFSRAVAVLTSVVALILLAGWWWNVPLLATAAPGQPSMTPNAAIGFALCGGSLLLSQETGPLRSRLASWLSLAVMAVGVATFGEYVWAGEPGIDYLLDDSLMALVFVLLGSLGLLVSMRRWLHLREGLAIALLAIAMTGLASYGIALASRHGLLFDRVPIYAMLLLLAVLGWLSSTPTSGLTRVASADTLGGAFARRLLLPALLLPVAFAFVFGVLQFGLGLPETLAFAFMALFSGAAVALLVWWVANLLDKLERQRRVTALLRNNADTDTLTGLANRRAFDEALARLLHGQREHDAMFSLLMLDLDRFKNYNDDFGHLAGDEVLRITGHLLGAALRPSDLAARYGGEEFALLLPHTDAAQASDVAARILGAFRGFAWPQRAVTISIGVAQSTAGDGIMDLIQRADAVLYDAKHAGRNQAVAATTAR